MERKGVFAIRRRSLDGDNIYSNGQKALKGNFPTLLYPIPNLFFIHRFDWITLQLERKKGKASMKCDHENHSKVCSSPFASSFTFDCRWRVGDAVGVG